MYRLIGSHTLYVSKMLHRNGFYDQNVPNMSLFHHKNFARCLDMKYNYNNQLKYRYLIRNFRN